MHIYDDVNKHMYIDPFCVKWKRDAQLLRTMFTSATDVIEEILPKIIYYNEQFYRMSNDALDFTLCLPVMDTNDNSVQCLNNCLCVNCYGKSGVPSDFEMDLVRMGIADSHYDDCVRYMSACLRYLINK